jgi:RNA polymerase sigma-70 factor (ECF subfamily)
MADKPIALNDLQLARRALKDSKSEESLLRRIYPRIFQIVQLAAGNRKQVDDIVQVAAIEVAKSLKRYRGLGSIEAWAGRIAYRTTVKFLKKQQRRSLTLMPLLDNDIPNYETPERSASRKQLFEVLVSKMNRIPEKRRAPLLLHLAYGYTIREVSELTDASPNTVKDRLKTAFREFQMILDEHPSLVAMMLEELQ